MPAPTSRYCVYVTSPERQRVGMCACWLQSTTTKLDGGAPGPETRVGEKNGPRSNGSVRYTPAWWMKYGAASLWSAVLTTTLCQTSSTQGAKSASGCAGGISARYCGATASPNAPRHE